MDEAVSLAMMDRSCAGLSPQSTGHAGAAEQPRRRPADQAFAGNMD